MMSNIFLGVIFRQILIFAACYLLFDILINLDFLKDNAFGKACKVYPIAASIIALIRFLDWLGNIAVSSVIIKVLTEKGVF